VKPQTNKNSNERGKRMRNREQKGTIVRINNRWYVRYYERQNVGGVLQRKRLTHLLGPVTSRGKHASPNIQEAASQFMQTVNRCRIPADHVVSFTDFVEVVFLPLIQKTKRPSTYKMYSGAWLYHVKPLVNQRVILKDVRTYDVQDWLDNIATRDLSSNSLKRIKSMLSGSFKHAKRLGYLDGINPTTDTAVSPNAAKPAETYAYSFEEIIHILRVLPEPAATAFAIAAFAGLREGEIAGLDWDDYHDDDTLHVTRSVWNGRLMKPKTKKSEAPVPVIRPLAERLESHNLRCGNPTSGPMFCNSLGKRLSFNNLLNRVILPTLNRCVRCGVSEGKAHLKQDHKFDRDARLPLWHGWHAARRGLGSNLYRLGVPDKTIQQILRHSNVNVTLGYYIKTASPDVVEAMERLEHQFFTQKLGDSERTLKPDSGAMPESIN
jgi:integrase